MTLVYCSAAVMAFRDIIRFCNGRPEFAACTHHSLNSVGTRVDSTGVNHRIFFWNLCLYFSDSAYHSDIIHAVTL